MQLHEPLNERKTYTASDMLVVYLVEPLKDPALFPFRYAGSCVADFDLQIIPAFIDLDCDASLVSVFECIGQQIVKDKLQILPVHMHRLSFHFRNKGVAELLALCQFLIE